MLMRGALLMLIAAGAAAAYPDHPIRFVVPVAAGGGNDIVARLLAQKLTDAWGQSVVVDNRPGAATAIGAEIVAKAIPDGYTIMLTSVSFAINQCPGKQPTCRIQVFAARDGTREVQYLGVHTIIEKLVHCFISKHRL